MKQLQNNYTTPEQSKRLLELGVPADSADCYYDGRRILRARSENWMLKPDFFKEYSYFTPCWSVGRLMEIITLTLNCEELQFVFKQDMVRSLIYTIASNHLEMDFSKLEE